MNDAFCGACCKSIRLSTQTVWLDRGDGVCRYFDNQQNTCSIYENRPEICNVKTMYDKHYKNNFSWSEFVAINQKSCDALFNNIDVVNGQ
jgi:Fe-S-cluster containining protein